MHIMYTRPVIVFITLLFAYAAATAADLESNGAEKAGADAAILSSNSSGNENLDLINMNRKKDGHLDNDSSSNQMKLKEAGDLRKVNNGSGIIGELTDVGDQNKSNDSSSKKGDEREGLKEAEVEKKRIDAGSNRDDKKKKTKEVEEQVKAKDISYEKQGEMDKILPDGIQSREEILPTRKETFHGEECDSSYSCTIEEKEVVACLRVPGNESPDLSLLVQNNGKGTVNILIKAPEFVQLEKEKIELQGKENQRMKVSIRNAGNDNNIILKAGDGQCTLDFRGLIDNADKTSQFKYGFSSFGIMCLAAIALVATVLIYFKRRLQVSSGHKYQKLDMDLPVSNGGKTETLSTDGWDNNWDDDWDDEEAPKAPSMPVTPSLSSKSISSRRSSKESWKD
ncbi:PREDICTED: uncharacterized protein LOC109211225 [Nicotiana attenuata]|uniref:DUF7356 domain-containing protein n=1 Tax=Nicotiana attenuata TaxID=49451 RepID=A0A314KJX1_NICAT|nr:PREDICTED: uncharacterized protein LOC109211225 [Nicotiana attenuata]OIT29540.1 hypothetical protein A4A49_16530 [Nicotiana attenuata]